MEIVTLSLNIRSPYPDSHKVSSSAAGRAPVDQGYVIVDSANALAHNEVFLYLDMAAASVRSGERVVSRKWWEKRMHTQITT